ncbi:MAG: hypothetical protein FJ403_20950 [Verrucomicrobia bacterium]|nr:hypothetical protein [Verrucomicrobiota bacterium]
MDLSDKERLIVGTLLHEVPSPLPEMLAKVLWHAPESFLDERLGTIAVTIREMELANKPVAPVTVRSSLSDGGRLDKAGGALFFDTIDSSAVTIPIADFEAADVWQAYVERQTESTLNDGLSALRSQPSSATVIVKGIIKSLERVATNGSNGPRTLNAPRGFIRPRRRIPMLRAKFSTTFPQVFPLWKPSGIPLSTHTYRCGSGKIPPVEGPEVFLK